MIKSELIQAMAARHTNLSVKKISQGVNLILTTLCEALAAKRRIEIRGFGSFVLHFHAPRKARNPKTGAWLLTKGKYVARFKPGKLLKAQVNEELVL